MTTRPRQRGAPDDRERRYREEMASNSPDDPKFRSDRPRLGGQQFMGATEEDMEHPRGYPTPDDMEFADYRPALDRDRNVGLRPGPYTGVGPRGHRRSDEDILDEVVGRLTAHGQLDARDIQVEVQNGEVTLTGIVADRRAKRLAEDLAWVVRGVQDVRNQLYLSSAAQIREGQGMVTGYGRLRNGLHVSGADGQTVGRVKEVRDNGIVVDRPWARDVFVPLDGIDTVSHTWLSLRVRASEVDDQGWPHPDEI